MRLSRKQSLAWWDILAPVRRVQGRYAHAEAEHFMLAQFDTFSDQLSSCRPGAGESSNQAIAVWLSTQAKHPF